MTGNEQVDKARAAQEARDAVGNRGARGSSAAEEALKRYLAAETVREHHREQVPDEPAPADDE
jgi:hypothetical protein